MTGKRAVKVGEYWRVLGGKALDEELHSIHLQGIGRHHAIPAGKLKVGDIIVYNYGYTSVVREKKKITDKTIEVVVESHGDIDKGKRYTVRYRTDRLVAVGRK